MENKLSTKLVIVVFKSVAFKVSPIDQDCTTPVTATADREVAINPFFKGRKFGLAKQHSLGWLKFPFLIGLDKLVDFGKFLK